MERLVYVAHKVNKKLERFLCAIIALLKPHRRVANPTKDVDARRACPTLLPKDTTVTRMVANTIDIV